MRGITRDTFGEMIDRKGALVAVVSIAIGIWIVLSSNWEKLRIAFEQTDPKLPYAPVDEISLHFLSTYATVLTGVVCLLAAGVIPAMLRSATTWFYFARPISRTRVLVEKLWAVVIVYLGLLLVMTLPVVVIASLRHYLFDIRVGEILLIHIFNCAVWLTLIVALGILLRSTIRVIAVSLAVYAAQLLLPHATTLGEKLSIPFLGSVLNSISFALPRMAELGEAAQKIASGGTPALFTPVMMTLLSVGLTLYFAIAKLSRQDLMAPND